MKQKSTKIALQLREFVLTVEGKIREHYRTLYTRSNPPTISLSVKEGGRFYKVVETENGTSDRVYCFVEKSTGDIYKAATYKAPAKHVRGSIFDENCGWRTAVNEYGAVYLR